MNQLIEGLLSQFVFSFGLQDEPKTRQFEYFINNLCMTPYLDRVPDPAELWTGEQEVGIDGVAVIVNGILMHDVDAFHAAHAGGTLDVQFIFAQAKTATNFDSSEIAKTILAIKDFFEDLSFVQGERVRELYVLQNAIFQEAPAFRAPPDLHIYYATNGLWAADPNVVASVNATLKPLQDSPNFGEVLFTPLGATEIRDRYFESKRQSQAAFTFISSIDLPEIGGVSEAKLGLVKAKDYLSAITRPSGGVNKSLFFDNLRDSLGETQPNKEMRETIDVAPSQFLFRNNGITIVARRMAHGKRGQVTLEDFQIVNGCQTSHVIYDAKEILPDELMLSVKVIVTDDDDITNGIIRGSNMSNDVKPSQLWSTTQFHKSLEILFEETRLGKDRIIYYERRKGQYEHRADIQRTDQIDPKELAKVSSAVFVGVPHDVTKYASTVEPRIEAGELFDDSHNPAFYVLAGHTIARINDILRKADFREYKPCRYHFAFGVFEKCRTGPVRLNAGKTDALADLSRLISDEKTLLADLKLMMTIAESLRTARKEDHFRNVAKLSPLKDQIQRWAADWKKARGSE